MQNAVTLTVVQHKSASARICTQYKNGVQQGGSTVGVAQKEADLCKKEDKYLLSYACLLKKMLEKSGF